MSFFQGRVVLVYLVSTVEAFAGGIAIVDPHIVDMEGRKFIEGRVPESWDDWAAGLVVRVAFDQIAHMVEFETEKDFVERSGFALSRHRGDSVQ